LINEMLGEITVFDTTYNEYGHVKTAQKNNIDAMSITKYHTPWQCYLGRC